VSLSSSPSSGIIALAVSCDLLLMMAPEAKGGGLGSRQTR
jgi:hypothetical protein